MPLMDQINKGFHKLLEEYSDGISNTSTAKYNEIKVQIANVLGLIADDVYATGCTNRISNLDTRLAQGNQRNQHTPLGLAFIKMDSKGRQQSEVIQKAKDSFTSTAAKFVTGEERGTSFDGVLGLLQIDKQDYLIPLRLLRTNACSYANKLREEIPALDELELVRPITTPSHPATVVTPSGASTTGKSIALDPDLIDKLLTSMHNAGLVIPRPLMMRFVASLLAKPFVILAGLAGSGKTKLALALAKWFEEKEGQVQIVAVGADWMSSEQVLGYRDALDESKYRRPTNGALDVILEASKDPNRPYFLILDEMNLSHVERYFADLLSAMESGEQIALHAGIDPVEGVPPRIELPRNLFILGTVNVDETTYMFSPKVLDRANVIEFRTSKEEILAFLDTPQSLDLTLLEGEGAPYAKLFVDAAAMRPRLQDLPAHVGSGAEIQQQLSEALGGLFDVLMQIGAEFGYRTVNEIARFTFFHALLTGKDWQLEDALDAQLVQKLMPKLHGSERRLRPVLDALGSFAKERQLGLGSAKVDRMLERLRDGFATFLD